MELSDFIAKSIAEVIKGLEKAETSAYAFGIRGDRGIEFDVAVRDKKTRRKAGGAKAGIGIVTLGGDTSKQDSDENVQRLRFTVYPKPIAKKKTSPKKK